MPSTVSRNGTEQEQQKYVAVDGHKENSPHNEQDGAEFGKGKNAIGNHLSDHQAERGDGGHGQLFEGAAFALAYEAQRDHQDRHDLKENRNQTGDKKVGRARCGIVEHRWTHLDGHCAIGQRAAQRFLERDTGGGAHGLAGDR
jgi:hypothetical protein